MAVNRTGRDICRAACSPDLQRVMMADSQFLLMQFRSATTEAVYTILGAVPAVRDQPGSISRVFDPSWNCLSFRKKGG